MTPFPQERPALCDKVLRFGFACPGRLRLVLIERGDFVATECDFCHNVFTLHTVCEAVQHSDPEQSS